MNLSGDRFSISTLGLLHKSMSGPLRCENHKLMVAAIKAPVDKILDKIDNQVVGSMSN